MIEGIFPMEVTRNTILTILEVTLALSLKAIISRIKRKGNA
jgi:hypothetical protein